MDAQFGAIFFVHRFGVALNSHIHFHVLATDGVFSADPQDATHAEFHPATNLDATKVKAVANQMRHRGLRWLVRHEHLDSDAAQDMGAWHHTGGWSVGASVHLPGWDRHGRLSDDLLVYRLCRPAMDGRTEIRVSPLQFLARLVDLLAPPRKHRQRDFGVLAPRARLRPVVTATAGPVTWPEMNQTTECPADR